MEKAAQRLIVALSLCAAPALAQSPLEGVAWLAKGQWDAKSMLPNGQVIESRIVVDFGPGNWSMRMQYFVNTKEGEYEQYETFFWVDPKGNGIRYLTCSVQGSVIEGKGEIKDGVMTLHQAKSKLYPEMRSTYRRDPKDENKYFGENHWNVNGNWKRVMNATMTRTPRASPKKMSTPERRGKLVDLEGFAGGDFRFFEKGKGVQLGRHRNFFSLHGRVLVGESWTAKDGRETPESLATIYVDPRSQEIRSVAVAANGKVTKGTARKENLGIVWDTTDFPRTGESKSSRTVIAFRDPDTYELQTLTKEGKAWKLSPYTLVGKRVKD